jgi:hypothetical protein
MDQSDVERSRGRSNDKIEAGNPLRSTTGPPAKPSEYLRFDRRSHEDACTSLARVLIKCSIDSRRIEFSGYVSQQRQGLKGEDSDRHYDSVHEIANDRENLEKLKKVCNRAAYEFENTFTSKQDSNRSCELAARKCAAALQTFYSKIKDPNSTNTLFRPVKPQYPAFDVNTISTLGKEATADNLIGAAMVGKELLSLMARSLEADDKQDLRHEVVWVNPNLTGKAGANREIIFSPGSSKKPMSAEERDKQARKRKTEGQSRQRQMKSEQEATLGSTSTDAARSVVPLNSRGLPEQASSRRVPHMGSSGIRKPKSQDLKKGKERQASSSGRASSSRNLSPFPNRNRSPDSEVSPNGSTAFWTPERFADFVGVPDSATQTSSPYHSEGSKSPGLTEGSGYEDYGAKPHCLPSSAANQQASGQYLQVSEFDSQDPYTTFLSHCPANNTTYSEYSATPTTSAHIPFTAPSTGFSYGTPQQQMYLYHNNTFKHGVAGGVPEIGSTEEFGGGIPTQAVAHRNMAGQSVISNHTNQEMIFSDDEIKSALSNTASVTPAPKTFSGWDVDNSRSNNPQILLTPAGIASGHLPADDAAFDWQNRL